MQEQYRPNLLILGAGGFGRLIFEYAHESGSYGKIAFLDDASADKRVLGKLEEYDRFKNEYPCALVAIGNNRIRLNYVQKLLQAGFHMSPFIFHPAWVSPNAQIGEGSFVLPGAVINADARIGKAALINCGAVIDHEATVEDGCHICLNAVVKSGCTAVACSKLEAGCVLEQKN